MTQSRYLVTGGAGFIGSHLTEHLLETGAAVTVLDNFSSGTHANLDGLGPDLKVVEGSVTSPDDIARALDGVDGGVFHLAALPSVVRSVEEPAESHEHNATGTLLVLDAARHRELRVVYAGSSSAYGEVDVAAQHELLREDPMSPYAATKLAGELYCRVFAAVYGMSIVVTRFFNVYGPRQVPDSPYSGVVAAFCFALLNAEDGVRPRIDGKGDQTRDFTYVTDVALGARLAMESGVKGCEVINLACGGTHSVADLLQQLIECSGHEVEPIFGPPRTGDIKRSMADTTRATEVLGFEPQVSFADGLQRTFDWYRSTYS